MLVLSPTCQVLVVVVVRVTDNTLQLLVAGVQGQPPSPAQLQEVRQKAAAKLQDLGPAAVLQDRASNDSKISQSRRRPYYDLLLVKSFHI